MIEIINMANAQNVLMASYVTMLITSFLKKGATAHRFWCLSVTMSISKENTDMRKEFTEKAFMYPMPVLIIAAYGEDGKPYCMNAAWGGISGKKQISMCVSPGHKTIECVRKKGEFTVSMGTVDYEVNCDYVGVVSANKVPDKFEQSGFHQTKSKHVDAPVIDELPMDIECRMLDYDEDSHILTGEVVCISADESIIGEDGAIDPLKLNPIIYDSSHRNYYSLGEVVGKAYSDGHKLEK